MKFIRTKEGIGIVLILAALITNPLTGSHIEVWIENAFQYMFRHGSWISLVAGFYVIGLMAYSYWKDTKLNIPSKTAKTEQQKYVTKLTSNPKKLDTK